MTKLDCSGGDWLLLRNRLAQHMCGPRMGVCMSVCFMALWVCACMWQKVKCGKERAGENRQALRKVRMIMSRHERSLTWDSVKESGLGWPRKPGLYSNQPRNTAQEIWELPRTTAFFLAIKCVFWSSTGFNRIQDSRYQHLFWHLLFGQFFHKTTHVWRIRFRITFICT